MSEPNVNGHMGNTQTTESNVSQPDEQYVVGIDFGTLSGRAVVVRVSDGVELGSATHDYTHGVMDSVLAGTGASLPPEAR